MKKIPLLLAVISFTSLALAEDKMDQAKDNTETNERDKTGETLTPVDQSNEAGDIRITADIRKALVADDALSTDAKNIKIITTKGGLVTLRGPVANLAEKEKIAAMAKKIAGDNQVTNEIEIASKSTTH